MREPIRRVPGVICHRCKVPLKRGEGYWVELLSTYVTVDPSLLALDPRLVGGPVRRYVGGHLYCPTCIEQVCDDIELQSSRLNPRRWLRALSLDRRIRLRRRIAIDAEQQMRARGLQTRDEWKKVFAEAGEGWWDSAPPDTIDRA
jgi:hypothetical protein